MGKLTKPEQIIAEKTVCVLLVRGESPDGNRIFAYVAVRADRLEEFMEAQRKGLFYPEDYGVVLASGEGDPAPEIREKMTKEYGFNHDNMLDIPSADRAHEIASHIREYTKPSEE